MWCNNWILTTLKAINVAIYCNISQYIVISNISIFLAGILYCIAAINIAIYRYIVILLHPYSPLTLHYLFCYMAFQVSYKIINVYLAGIHLEHLERGLEDPTKDELLHLLSTGIKRSRGVPTYARLPITINVLQTLKSKLCMTHHSLPGEKVALGSLYLEFYGFLQASESATSNLIWQHIHLGGNRYTVL